MLRINVYIGENLNKKLDFAARLQRKVKAQIIREALEKGLEAVHPQKSRTAQALVDLAKMAEAIPTRGKVPRDFSKNLDYYTWGGKKRE